VPHEIRHHDRPPSSFAFVAASVACLAFFCACSLDNRHLEAASGGGGSSQAGAGGNGLGLAGSGAAAGESAGRGGQGGAVEPSIPVQDGCADLDIDNVADCSETIVENADFKADVSNWLAGMDVTVDWDAGNAAGDLPSGSALVASTGVIDASGSGVALRAAQQCVPIDGSRLVIAYANAFVDSEQDPQGRAEVDVVFFDSQDCSGPLTTTFSTPQPLDSRVDAWFTLKAGSVSGATTKSAQIKLGVLKPFRAPSFRARFDNVLVTTASVQP